MFISYCHSPDLWGARRPYIIPFSGDNLNLHLNINFWALFRKANIYNMRCSFKLFNFASIEMKGRITTAILLFEKKITTLKIILSLLYKHKYSWYWAGYWVWCSELFIYNSHWDCCYFLPPTLLTWTVKSDAGCPPLMVNFSQFWQVLWR